MSTKEVEYLGDGVYVSHDGFMLRLSTEREGREHYIYLEPAVLNALYEYVRRRSKPAPPSRERGES